MSEQAEDENGKDDVHDACITEEQLKPSGTLHYKE
jgi:hypothetical protein